MAKAAKGATIGLLQSAARLSRTALAERLLEYGLYAGQDKLMLALSVENGQTPSQLANLLGVRPALLYSHPVWKQLDLRPPVRRRYIVRCRCLLRRDRWP